jgi:osmotically-inducible protein OsmY
VARISPADLILVAALPALLGGCSPWGVAIGAGATAANAASEERGFGQAVDDNRIALAVQAKLLAADAGLLRKVDVEVRERRVLLAGRVEARAMRVEAARLAWEVDGVKEVIDEVVVAGTLDTGQYLHDLWIAEKLAAVLLVDAHVRSINYNIDCVAGTIYLMGIAQDQAELQRVIDHARDIAYVRQVVSYVRVKGDPARGGPTSAMQRAAGDP